MANLSRDVAIERIHKLFRLARETIIENPDLAQRYAETARRVAMAARIRLPKEFRHQICRNCKSFILPGVNCRVRIKQKRKPHVVVTCFNCGKHMRILLTPKEK